MKEISLKMYNKKEEIEYLSNTLKNYFYLKKKEKDLNQEILNLDYKIENERLYINSSGTYDVIAGSGCSVNVPRPQSVNYLVEKQARYITERDEVIKLYTSLDKDNRIIERLNKLSIEAQIIINNVYQRGLTITNIAKIEKVSKQTISNRLDRAHKELLRS